MFKNMFSFRINKQTKFILLFIICLIISILIIIGCMKYSHIEIDDITTSYKFNEFSFKDILLKEVYRGKYIGSFLTRITAFTLPDIFKIHPVIWTQTWGAAIKAICLYLTCFACAMFMYFKRSYVTSPITALLLVLYIWEKFIERYQNNLYTSFYCFIFPFLFFFIFWYFILKVFFNEKIKLSDIVIISIFGFLNGLASECTAITAFSALFVLVILTIWRRNKEELKVSILAFLANALGFFVYFISPDFQAELASRGVVKSINDYIQYWNEVHVEFINAFIRVFIFDYSGYILLAITLLILLNYKLENRVKSKLNICVIAYIMGIIAFKISLFFALRHSGTGPLYVTHEDLIWQVKFAFMAIILFELSFFKNFKERMALIITIVLLFAFASIKDYTSKEKCSDCDREEYYNRYLNERYLAYFAYKNLDKVYLYKTDHEQNAPEILFLSYAFACPFAYSENYYGKSYELDKIVFYINYDELYKKYLEEGGCSISPEEFKKADFNKLLDKNYVLTCKE